MTESEREKRKRLMKKAINTIGRGLVARLKTDEDRAIFREVDEELQAETKAWQDEKLKELGLTF